MRYTGEARIRLHGDREAATLLIPHARTLLGDLMARNAAIAEGRIGPKISDSVISNLPREPLGVIQHVAGPIKVGVYNGVPIIDIYAPKGAEEEEEVDYRGYIIWSRDHLTAKFGALRDSLIAVPVSPESTLPPLAFLDTNKQAAHVLWADSTARTIYSCNPSGVDMFNDASVGVVRYRPEKRRSIYHPNSPTSVTTLRTQQQIIWAGSFTGAEHLYVRGGKIDTTGVRVLAVGGYNGDLFVLGKLTNNNAIRVFRHVDGAWNNEYTTTITIAYTSAFFSQDGQILLTHSIRGEVNSTAIGSNAFDITNAQLAVIQIIPSAEGGAPYTYNFFTRAHPNPILYYTVNMNGGGGQADISATATGEDHICLDWDDDNTRLKSLFEKSAPGAYATRTYNNNILTVDVSWANEIRYAKYALGASTIQKDLIPEIEEEYLLGTYGTVGVITGERWTGTEDDIPECLTGNLYHYGGAATGSFFNRRFHLVDADLRYDTVCFIESEVTLTPTETYYVCSLTSNNDNGPYVRIVFQASSTVYTLKVWRKGEIVYEGVPHIGHAPHIFTWTLVDYTVVNSQRWVDEVLGLAFDQASVSRYREYRNPISQLTALRRPRASFVCRDAESFMVSVRWALPNDSNPDKPYADEAILWRQPVGAAPQVYTVTDLLAKDGLNLSDVDLETFTAFPIRAF